MIYLKLLLISASWQGKNVFKRTLNAAVMMSHWYLHTEMWLVFNLAFICIIICDCSVHSWIYETRSHPDSQRQTKQDACGVSHKTKHLNMWLSQQNLLQYFWGHELLYGSSCD